MSRRSFASQKSKFRARSRCLDTRRAAAGLFSVVPYETYLYFIQQGKSGPIKIGIATDLVRRLLQLQNGNPEQLCLLRALRGADYAVEAKVHERFAKERVLGEWFEPSSRLLRFIESVDYCSHCGGRPAFTWHFGVRLCDVCPAPIRNSGAAVTQAQAQSRYAQRKELILAALAFSCTTETLCIRTGLTKTQLGPPRAELKRSGLIEHSPPGHSPTLWRLVSVASTSSNCATTAGSEHRDASGEFC